MARDVREVWRDVYCANVTCKPTGRGLGTLDKFADTYKSSPASLRQLGNLIGDPITEDCIPWIDELFHQCLDQVGDGGFKVKDLPDITRILEFLGWKTREIPEYQPHLERILEIVGRPPELGKASDVLSSSKILDDYFTNLGRLIVLLPTQRDIAKLLTSIHELMTRPKKPHASAIKLDDLLNSAQNSQLPVILAKLIDIFPPEVWKHLLQVIHDLVRISNICCRKMLEENILNSLLPQLEYAYPRLRAKNDKEGFLILVRVIWTLMRCAYHVKIHDSSLKNLPPPNPASTRILTNVFMQILHDSSSEIHVRTLRNDLAMIILAGVISMPTWKLPSSGLALDLMNVLKSSQVPKTPDDLSFLKALLAILSSFAASAILISMMKEANAISGILQLLPIDEPSKIPKNWSQLTPYVLRTLAKLVPHLWEGFVKFQGPSKLIIIMEYSMTRDLNPTTILECIRTICSILATKSVDILKHFKTSRIINLHFRLIDRLVILDEFTLHNQTLLTLLLTNLEYLLEGDNSLQSVSSQKTLQKPAQGAQGLDLALKLLQRLSQDPEGDFLIDDKLIISVSSFTWRCLVPSPPVLKRLLERGGTYVILDALERSSRLPQIIFLGILSDMCADTRCIPHLCTWRGLDKSKGLSSLLAKIWREEEKRIGVRRTSRGCIEDIELPLMGKTQWRNSFYRKPLERYSATVESLLGSARPKIYAIRQQLLAKSEVCERVKDHYKILGDGLPSEDSITFCIIDQFFRFTKGQVWGEVLRYLKQQGVNPLGADEEMLLVMCQRHRECGLYVRDCQEKVLRDEEERERLLEVEDLQRIRNAKLGDALKAVKTLDLIRRTADADYRAERRREQKGMVDRGLRFPRAVNREDCHRTYPDNWNVTTIWNQTLMIKTTRSRSDVRRISPTSSTSIAYPHSEDWNYE